ncbi:hypothetical protein QTO30_02140 [Yoonia sp. GPGPB17]|uniref:hypothetical protein n=1 Tax=Yoonia sp. GPGPB17 TaxID=3026147 RepID=UPI0030BEAB8E
MENVFQTYRFIASGIHLIRQSFMMTAACIVCGTSAFAQDSETVTLKFYDGDGISGELIEANDQFVMLRSSIGMVTIPVEGVSCIGQACPEAMRFVPVGPTLTFTTTDGSVEVMGQLIEISNDQYVIATNLGELRINVDGAICSGDGCPDVGSQPTFGGDVILTNGATVIEGKLIGIEGAAYLVEVPTMGAIRVDSGVFECAGASCP